MSQKALAARAPPQTTLELGDLASTPSRLCSDTLGATCFRGGFCGRRALTETTLIFRRILELGDLSIFSRLWRSIYNLLGNDLLKMNFK